jgi:hypothetical protein
MIIKIEKIQKDAENKYLSWNGNPTSILKFLDSVRRFKISEQVLKGYRMLYVPDDIVPLRIKTSLTENYYNATHLWWIKTKYVSEKFKIPLLVAQFFSILPTSKILEMHHLNWCTLTLRDRMFALQMSVLVKDQHLVMDLSKGFSLFDLHRLENMEETYDYKN